MVHSARRDLVRSHINRWASASAAPESPRPSASIPVTMPTDPNSNSEPYRRFSREPQSATSSSTPSSLPPLRSVASTSTRNSASIPTLSTSAGRRARWRGYGDRNRTPTVPDSASRGDSQQYDDEILQILMEQAPRRVRLVQPERDLQHLSDLDEANNQLRALLDFTNPPSHPYPNLSFPSPPLQVQEPVDENRRVKRRKLDADSLSTGFQGFRYGRYGQVESGPLTMEIVSCDGGIYSDDGQTYAAENILKNDATVYCTKGPRCNIVLRHQGSTVFTLKELVIKAPRTNYTSPVQEGMIFISMNQDDLLSRTAQYKIQYQPSRSSSRRVERENQPPAILSIRHGENGTTMTRAQVRARRLYNIGIEDENNNNNNPNNEEEYRVAQIPPEFTTSPPQFHVTTVCSDDEDEPALRPDWRAPNRIGSLPFESDDSSGDDLSGDIYGLDYHRRRRRRRTPLWETGEDTETAAEASQDTLPPEGKLMAPHARFFIEQNKSKCTIKFEPAVSGRFILLKMWSPHPDPTSNIDIQAVVANGFAGPRYFPAMELR